MFFKERVKGAYLESVSFTGCKSVEFVVITSTACPRVDNFFLLVRTILIVFLLISYLFRCNSTFPNLFSSEWVLSNSVSKISQTNILWTFRPAQSVIIAASQLKFNNDEPYQFKRAQIMTRLYQLIMAFFLSFLTSVPLLLEKIFNMFNKMFCFDDGCRWKLNLSQRNWVISGNW